VNSKRTLICWGALAIFVALLGASSVVASGGAAPLRQNGAPALLNYQGLLLDPATGDPIADGNYTLTFAIYDDATSTDPSHRLWEETQTVSTQNGLFNVMLGATNPIDTTWLDGRDLWLGITVQGESEMTPRQQLGSVPYALNANDVRGADIHPDSVYASHVSVSSPGDDGVYVAVGGSGVFVEDAGGSGVEVGTAGYRGVAVSSAGDDGVRVGSAGSPSTTSSSTLHNGFEVAGAEGNGLHVGRADGDGVYVGSAGFDGVSVYSAGSDGVYVQSASYGVAVSSVVTDGVWVGYAGRYAGNFSGDVQVTGNLSKGGGSFKIDHPLDPQNQYLYHSFVESPDMMNVYNGNVTLDAQGEAWVELPAWFEALNRDYRHQLTCIGGFAPVYVAQEIQNNRFQIAGGTPGLKVSWQVTGIRHDPYAEANRIPVEEDKPPDERGTYLHPRAYGQPETMGLAYKEARAKENRAPPPER
jgi:hypothetical protein